MTAPIYSQVSDRTDYGNKPGDGPLKPGGQPGTAPEREPNLPSTPNAATKRQANALSLVRDVLGGTETIRGRRETYLPKNAGEHPEDYLARLNRSVFFNVYGKTVEGLTGFVFAKDPVLGDDVPVQIKGTDTQPGQWENIDNAGTHGDVFVRDLFQEGLGTGHTGVFVEYPKTGGTQDVVDERTTIRPYWIPIQKDNIVSWRTAVVDGRVIFTQLVFKECVMVPVGAFGEKEETRYRVLYKDLNTGVVGFRLLTITEDKKLVVLDEGTYPTQTEIPFAEIPTSGRRALLDSQPPLLDLAYLNIAHYQTWSDRATSAHMTCVPIWVESGVDPEPAEDARQEIVLGATSARRFSNPQAKAGYESHDGASLAEVSKIIEEIKSDAAVLGLSMLSTQSRRPETAEAKRIDKGASDSQLAVAARGLQDGVERALYFHAKYLGEEDGGSITINRDFESTLMDAAMMTAYATLAEKMGLPVRVILQELQSGGRIPEDADLDELVDEIMANQAAIEAQKAAEAAAQMDAAKNGDPAPAKAA